MKNPINLQENAFKGLIVVLTILLMSVISSQTALANKDYVEGEVLVKFKNGVSSALVNRQTQADVLQEFPELSWQLVKLPANLTVEQGINAYQNLDGIESVQPNYIYRVLATPNDPRYGELYGMTQISAPTAWDTTTGSSGIVVAVIDTGIKFTHEDLAPNMWQNPGEIAGNGIDDDSNGFIDDVYGYDFADNDSDPSDVYNHGTHVAGTIGAAGNNSLGVTGVNWQVKIMALRIHDAAGNSTSAKVIQAFQYARMMRLRGVTLRVTNNSYGGAPEAPGFDQATKDAIDAAGEANILNVFASGNNNRDIEALPFYPASYNSPSILVVAASGVGDVRATFSNYGTTSVDLAAPGAGILSTVIGIDNSTYGINSGTSMAAPHTAGAAALLAAANPSLTAASLKATLMNRVDLLPVWNGVLKTGGRLNIASAIANQTVCNFGVPMGQNFPIAGGTGTINVTAAVNCDFPAVSLSPWITVTAGNPGSGNGTVDFTVSSNAGNPARTGFIKIADQVFTVSQAGVAPTGASVTVGGRVTTAEGRGIRNARVTMTDRSGYTRTVVTNPLGYYRFTEVPSGESYVFSVISKKFSFASQFRTITEDAMDINFTADSL
jgi:subtilisin family serine protease